MTIFSSLQTFITRISCLFIIASSSNLTFGQNVTTNGGSGLAASYSTLAQAITALNSATINSPVVITLSGNETAPAGGYEITKSGTSTNTITIQGSSSTITASSSHVAGRLNDAVFKIIGADYITLQNFTMEENSANTVTDAATNNMTEFGVALFYATTTNGAQNCTIQNNTISLNRLYQNSFGIYSNTSHSSLVVTTTSSASSSAGSNSNLQIYSNTIQNVNQGISVVGNSSQEQTTGIDIGGNSLATGNVINNFGSSGTFSAFTNVSASVKGINTHLCIQINVSYNQISSSDGGTLNGHLIGVSLPVIGSDFTGVFTNTVKGNSISLQHGANTGDITGVHSPSAVLSFTNGTLQIINNDIIRLNSIVNTNAAITAIRSQIRYLYVSINNNTFTNLTVNSSGNFTFINHDNKILDNGTMNINNNAIVTNFTKTLSGGSVTISTTNATYSPSTSSFTQTGNNFSNISVIGSATLTGFNNSDGNNGFSCSKTISGNTMTNWSAGTGTIKAMIFGYWGQATTNLITNNTISGFTSNGNIEAITVNSSGNGINAVQISGNTISNLNGAIITAISCAHRASLIFQNTISNLTSNASSLTGISVTGISDHQIYQNNLSQLIMTGSNSSAILSGISIVAGVNIALYENLLNGFSLSNSNNSGSSNTQIRGLFINSGTTVSVYRNRVSNLNLTRTSPNTTSSAQVCSFCLENSGTTFNIYNNLFGSNTISAANGSNLVIGMLLNSGTTINASYNTIYLDNISGGGGDFGGVGIYAATTPTLTLVNNLVRITGTPSGLGKIVAYKRATNSLSTYSANSNNNLFYAGTPNSSNLLYAEGSTASNLNVSANLNSQQTLNNYKTFMSTRDQASQSLDPSFISTQGSNTNYLRIDPSSNTTGIDGAGVVVSGITTDFDGDTRNNTSPDIGADEFTSCLNGSFLGSVNGLWSNAANWCGGLPANNTNVLLPEGKVVTLDLSGVVTIASLTINSTAVLNMDVNSKLTLSGALTNNGTFAMRDGAIFVQATSGTSVSGTGTYNIQKLLSGNSSTWNTTNSGRFWYMGVPMNSVARSSFGNYNETSNRLFSYSESTKQYTNIMDNSVLLTRGTGFVHRRSSNDTLTFTATGANGLYGEDLTLSGLSRTSGASVGFHLVSNPYMGYLDWNAITKTNVEPTFYVRSNNAGNDISALISYNSSTNNYTNTSSVNITTAEQIRYLAPLQAIWIRVGPNTGTGSLAMTRSMLSHQTGNPGLKNTTIFPTLARVNLVDGARFDQMLVFMNQDMSNSVDEYDSEKMFVSGNPQIYTMAAGKKLVMNGLNSNKKKISVPLFLELPTSKIYQLQLAEYELEDGLILLEDKQEGTIQDFTIHDTYAFYANSGVLQNRFVLHFYMPDATITAQGPSNTWVEDEATSYTEGGNIVISSDAKGKVQISLDQPETEKVEGTVQATDANGRVVYSGALEGLTTEFQLNVPAGIYYLTVQSGNIIENKKVFIQD